MRANIAFHRERFASEGSDVAAYIVSDAGTIIARLRATLARSGSVAAAVLLVLTVAWIVTLLIAPAPAEGADAAAQLRFWDDHEGWLVASFVFTAPLSLVHVPVWLALATRCWAMRPLAALLGVAFGLLYAPFPLWAYWTQMTTVRSLVDLHREAPAEAIAAYQVLGFGTGDWSVAYSASVLGYGLWGLAALCIAWGLLSLPGRLARWTGLMFGTAAVLGIAGAIGFVAAVPALEVGVLLSGVVFLPALGLTAALLGRDTGEHTASIIHA